MTKQKIEKIDIRKESYERWSKLEASLPDGFTAVDQTNKVIEDKLNQLIDRVNELSEKIES